MTDKTKELAELKKKAIKLYHKSIDFADLDCGRAMAETIRPEIYTARMQFNEIWERIEELDPDAPPSALR